MTQFHATTLSSMEFLKNVIKNNLTMYKKNLGALFSLCLFAFLLTNCGLDKTPSKRNIKDFYFPLEKIGEKGIVYAYDAQNVGKGVKNTEYWHIQSIKTDSGHFVKSTYYDPSLTRGITTLERVVESGVLLEEMYFSERDTITGTPVPVKATIVAGNSFPFLVTDSVGLFLYSVKYHPLNSPESWNYLIRNKRYYGNGHFFDFKNNKLQTILFKSKEAAGNDGVGAAELEGRSEQHYAKNLGLVSYEKRYAAYHQSYALVDTFSYDILLQKAKENNFR